MPFALRRDPLRPGLGGDFPRLVPEVGGKSAVVAGEEERGLFLGEEGVEGPGRFPARRVGQLHGAGEGEALAGNIVLSRSRDLCVSPLAVQLQDAVLHLRSVPEDEFPRGDLPGGEKSRRGGEEERK